MKLGNDRLPLAIHERYQFFFSNKIVCIISNKIVCIKVCCQSILLWNLIAFTKRRTEWTKIWWCSWQNKGKIFRKTNDSGPWSTWHVGAWMAPCLTLSVAGLDLFHLSVFFSSYASIWIEPSLLHVFLWFKWRLHLLVQDRFHCRVSPPPRLATVCFLLYIEGINSSFLTRLYV